MSRDYEYYDWLHSSRLVARFMDHMRKYTPDSASRIEFIFRMLSSDQYKNGGWESTWAEIFTIANEEINNEESRRIFR